MGSWTDDPARRSDERYREPSELKAVHPPHVQRDIERREALRAEELAHLAELRERVQRGLDEGVVDLSSATEMLLNITKVRTTLAGVGMYPGAW